MSSSSQTPPVANLTPTTRPLVASGSEISIATQLLEDDSCGMLPAPTPTSQVPGAEENIEEDAVSNILQDEDSVMLDECEWNPPTETLPPKDALTTNTILPDNYPPVIYPSKADSFAAGAPGIELSEQAACVDNLNATNSEVDTIMGEDRGEKNAEDDGDEGDDGDEDENEEEDMSSEVSEGGDLQDELQDALEDGNFSFHGSFYHSSLLPLAPNPCLYISGLGLVGLPLSERDAKAVISCATLAPFGHGERTVVDKNVRDTWEIEPARVSFANEQWGKYINETVCAQVCKSLGVTISGKSAPKMELYKLLVYETGSHFLPHQDTQKANGMFATVIVLLPSAYTGGELIVSHTSQTKTIDFSQNSLLSTALLAWYTDVKHEVKPVTSGYRLALSYNLIHVAPPNVLTPALPDMNDSVGLLRRVLRKWKHKMYQGESEQRIVAYLLDHEYSTMNLKDGLAILKGADAHRVTFLRPVAEEMGFMVGLASLEHNISGCGDDDGGHYHHRGRYGWSSDEDDDPYGSGTPGMLEVSDTTTSISGLVNLDGGPLVPTGKIYLDDDCLIPKDPFEDKEPDDTDYEGYMGNGAGQLDYWYRRTVLVLMHEDDLDDVCYQAEGLSYAFRLLKRSTAIPPTAEDRKWANRLLERSNSNSWTKDHLMTMMEYSLKWQDLDMWKAIMKCSPCSLKAVGNDVLLKAWRLFSFENVRVSFEEILARSRELPERMTFIYNIPPKATNDERETVHAWCKKESDKILSSYSTANVQDIPTIMSVIRVAGLNAFIQSMIPNLSKKSGTYAFWLALRKSLTDGRDAILERQAKSHSGTFSLPPAASSSEGGGTAAQISEAALMGNVLDELIKTCLRLASSQWADGPIPTHSSGYPYYGYQPASNQPHMSKIDRIIEIIEQCIISDEMEICKALFVAVLQAPGTSATRFTQIYTPLIPRLRSLLTKMKRDLCTPPFLDLMQVFIGTYLRDVLGKKGQLFNCNLRKIGCGCGDCQPLDTFIMDPKSSETTFRLAQHRRNHLEHRLANARDLCIYQTIRSGSPHGLKVTKLPAVVQASMWEYRQKAAKAFLASIGPSDVLAKIIGVRYADVNLALNGTQLFGSVKTVQAVAAARPAPSLPVTMTSSTSSNGAAQASSSNAVRPAAAATAQPQRPSAGKKRKNAPLVQLGPVIDLTGDDSS